MPKTSITRRVAYHFSFWNALDLVSGVLAHRGKDRAVVYFTEHFKTRASPNILLVFGPRLQGHPLVEHLNKLQKQKLAKELWRSDTGHGGQSTIWIVYNPLKVKKLVKKIPKKKPKTS